MSSLKVHLLIHFETVSWLLFGARLKHRGYTLRELGVYCENCHTHREFLMTRVTHGNESF
jgi:hypothetical protein